MIYYHHGGFYNDDKKINKPHNGITMLDLCEQLLLCPISIAGQGGYYTALKFSGYYVDNERVYDVYVKYRSNGHYYRAKSGTTGYDLLMSHMTSTNKRFGTMKQYTLRFDEAKSWNHRMETLVFVELCFEYGITVAARIGEFKTIPSYFQKLFGNLYLLSVFRKNSGRSSLISSMNRYISFEKMRADNLKKLFDRLDITNHLKAELAALSLTY